VRELRRKSMLCPQCNRDLPYGATHCPYCGVVIGNVSPPGAAASSPPQTPVAERQTFCVKCGAPLPANASFCTQCSTPRQGATLRPPNAPVAPVAPLAGQLVCPRCGSTNVLKGKIAQWAIIAAIVGFFIVCVLSLFFLLVKEPNRCLNCGYEFK
jgi:hypothetical protein